MLDWSWMRIRVFRHTWIQPGSRLFSFDREPNPVWNCEWFDSCTNLRFCSARIQEKLSGLKVFLYLILKFWSRYKLITMVCIVLISVWIKVTYAQCTWRGFDQCFGSRSIKYGPGSDLCETCDSRSEGIEISTVFWNEKMLRLRSNYKFQITSSSKGYIFLEQRHLWAVYWM